MMTTTDNSSTTTTDKVKYVCTREGSDECPCEFAEVCDYWKNELKLRRGEKQ